MTRKLKIKALKYPNHPHYEWGGELLYSSSDYVVTLSRPGRTFIHHTREFEATLHSTYLEYFSFEDWFNVLMEIEEGKVVSYYCNIAMPPTLKEDEISFVDLDLDLAREKNEEHWQVLDEDEFELNRIKYNYPDYIKEKALSTLKDLKERAENSKYPFNNKLLDEFKVNI